MNSNLKIDTSLSKNGYKIKKEGLNKVIESLELNAYLFNGGKLRFEVNLKAWRAPSSVINELKSKLLTSAKRERRIVFDSKKVRLSSDPKIETKQKYPLIQIQPTTYLEGFWTNEATRYDLKLENRTIFQGSSLFIQGEVISPLESSHCANFIGVSTLLIGSGVTLPLVRQSARSAVASSKIAPSGSGSMDWEDLGNTDENFNQVICRAAERELREEMGLLSEISLESQVIGYQRTLSRGGKPEFFCVTWVKNDLGLTKLTKSEKLFTHHADALPIDWGDKPKIIAGRLKSYNKENSLTFSQALQNALELFSVALIQAKPTAPFLKALQSRKKYK